jgi:polar amino acid transport system substrate-binding protein
MRHRLSIGAIVLVAAAVAAGTAAAARSAKIAPPANIASAGKIVYCMDISFPPFESYTAGNKPIGAEVDLGTAFATLMGVKASFRNKASRRKVVDFVDYALLGNSIVVQKGNPRHVTGLDTSLAGLKVGVQAGTTLRLQLIAENTKLKKAGKAQITVVSFPKDSDAFQNLIAGNVDAYYTVTSTAAYYGKKTGGKTEIAGPQVSAFPFGIATRKSDKQLHQAFAKGLAMLRANGQYLAILKRWGVANAALKG